MRLPHNYRGYTITARKSRTSDKTILEIRKPDPRLTAQPDATILVKSYTPSTQVIYFGVREPVIAYDHDIEHLEAWIDTHIEKAGNFNRQDLITA